MWWRKTSDDGAVPAVSLETSRHTAVPAAHPFFTGDGFTLSNPERETIVYSEGDRRWSLLAAWGVSPPEVRVPRPEVWDAVVPPWLRGRYDIVTSRLIEHSGHTVVFDPDSWYDETLQLVGMETGGTRQPCPCCDAEVMTVEQTYPSGQVALEVGPTQRAIEERLSDGRFEVIRADVPVDEIVDLLISDTKYTIITYLRCTVSNETILWGLAIRGTPIYQHVLPMAPFVRRWEDGYPRVDNAPDRPTLNPDAKVSPGVLPVPVPPSRPRLAGTRPGADRDLHIGVGYSIAEASDGVAYLVPFRGRHVFPTRWTGRRPAVLLPRPELWDANVPRFLRGRREIVAARLQEWSGHDVESVTDGVDVEE